MDLSHTALAKTVEAILNNAETAERSWSEAATAAAVSSPDAGGWIEEFDAAVKALIDTVLCAQGRFVLGFALGAHARATAEQACLPTSQSRLHFTPEEAEKHRLVDPRGKAAALTAEAGEKSQVAPPRWTQINHPGDQA